jgi:hypothetical protein
MMSSFYRLSMTITLMLVASSTCLSTAAEAAISAEGFNFLSNSGFESGELFPWRTGSKFTHLQEWTVTDSDSQSGIFSARAVGDVGLRQDFTSPVDAIDITELTFWVKTPNANQELAIVWHLSGGTVHQTGVVGRQEWTFIDATPRINRNMTDIMAVEFFGYSTNNLASAVTFYDSFQLSVVPEPSTIALSLGAVLCALLRPDRKGKGIY